MDSPRLQDGKMHERPMLPRAILKRPFADRQVPDIATKTYEQRYAIARARYAPAIATRTPAPPVFSGAYLGPADTADTSAYLVQETDLDPVDQLRAMVRRTFAHIPADQVSFDTRVFNRPTLHDIFSGTYYAVSFDAETSHIWPSRKTASISGTPDVPSSVSGGATLGTLGHVQISIELDNSAQTFYADDSDSTIKNALATAYDGSTTTSAYFFILRNAGSLIISRTLYNTSIKALSSQSATTVVASLAGAIPTSGTGLMFSVTASANLAASVRTISSTAHGGSAGQLVALWNGSKLWATGKVISATTDAFTVELDAAPGKDDVVTHCEFAPNGLRLVNGAKDCTIRTTEKFYLPTVTTGITTGADVPSVPLFTDPIAWLGRIVATTHTSVTATAATDKLTKTAHGMVTGDCFIVLVLGGATGLATLTQYFAIKVDADNWKAAASQAAAIAGTAVDITVDGTAMTVLVPAPYAAIGVSKLASWLGPILTKSYDEVELADALEVRSPSA